MKDKWKLYIIFLILFNFGDLVSTEINLVQKEAHPERVISDKCRVTLPPECDSSPILRQANSAFSFSVISFKILGSLIVTLFVLFWSSPLLIYTLLALNVGLIYVVMGNFSISFWKVAFLFNIVSVLLILLLLLIFTKLKEEKNADKNQE